MSFSHQVVSTANLMYSAVTELCVTELDCWVAMALPLQVTRVVLHYSVSWRGPPG